jgi:hypothetical protein
MEANTFTFTIVTPVPAGVTMAEFADHLADAHRLTIASYDPSDPMSGMGGFRSWARCRG